jgi:hypothetical protein
MLILGAPTRFGDPSSHLPLRGISESVVISPAVKLSLHPTLQPNTDPRFEHARQILLGHGRRFMQAVPTGDLLLQHQCNHQCHLPIMSQRQVQQEPRCDYVPELPCRLRSVVALGGNKLSCMHSRNILKLEWPELMHQVWSRHAQPECRSHHLRSLRKWIIVTVAIFI